MRWISEIWFCSCPNFFAEFLPTSQPWSFCQETEFVLQNGCHVSCLSETVKQKTPRHTHDCAYKFGIAGTQIQ